MLLIGTLSEDFLVGYDYSAVTRCHLSAFGISDNLANQVFARFHLEGGFNRHSGAAHLSNARRVVAICRAFRCWEVLSIVVKNGGRDRQVVKCFPSAFRNCKPFRSRCETTLKLVPASSDLKYCVCIVSERL